MSASGSATGSATTTLSDAYVTPSAARTAQHSTATASFSLANVTTGDLNSASAANSAVAAREVSVTAIAVAVPLAIIAALAAALLVILRVHATHRRRRLTAPGPHAWVQAFSLPQIGRAATASQRQAPQNVAEEPKVFSARRLGAFGAPLKEESKLRFQPNPIRAESPAGR